MATRNEMQAAARQRDIATLTEAIKVLTRHTPPVGTGKPMERIPWHEAIKLMRRVKAQLESEDA